MSLLEPIQLFMEVNRQTSTESPGTERQVVSEHGY